MNAPANVSPIKQFQHEFEQREESFAVNLPKHIPFERYKRVVLSAVQRNPDLLVADRASLLIAAMDAATDGLLPDGRESAFVVYNTKVKRDGKDVWIKKVQFMPMIFGILKKVRNSGELKSITANLVYGGDNFRYWVDERGEHIQHEPADNPDKNIFRRAYAMAITKDDGVYIAVLDADDVEKIRNVSRSKDKGPWSDWWEEMVKKSAMRRLAKRLPLSTDLDDLMRRDDALYDFETAKQQRAIEAPRSLAGRLDALAQVEHKPGVQMDIIDNDTGEIVETNSQSSDATAASATDEGRTEGSPTSGAAANSAPEAASEDSGNPAADKPSADSPPNPRTQSADGDLTGEQAYVLGRKARTDGRSKKACPKEIRTNDDLFERWVEGFDDSPDGD